MTIFLLALAVVLAVVLVLLCRLPLQVRWPVTEAAQLQVAERRSGGARAGWVRLPPGLVCCVWTAEGDAAAPLEAVLVHGANACALSAWRHLIGPLRQRFRRLHMPDLPGFGFSPGTRGLYADSLQAQAVLADVVRAVAARAERPVVLIGHSMGAVAVAAALAAAGSATCAGTMLICPVGALPTLGGFGAWWSLIFQYGIPHRQLHALRGLLSPAARALLPVDAVSLKWIRMLDARAVGFEAPQAFVRTRPGRHFADPWLGRLSALSLLPPMAVVSGGRDSLVPPHIGRCAVRMLRPFAREFVVAEAGHGLDEFTPAALAPALRWLEARALGPPDTPTPAASPLPDFPDVAYRTSFSVRTTRAVLRQFYRWLERFADLREEEAGEAGEAGEAAAAGVERAAWRRS